ncbi:hypothetical protein [Pseudomonas sp. NBRC 111137]|nr:MULTISPECIES: hypothetical protein [Pseudomonas]ASN69795.1 hypothetical protein 3S18_27 [uncultured Caudovirales phage]ASN69884.1 hypothetical protein 7AX6_15 [uncultured Caudovirales phage]ASN70659.1 hypothetical protein 2AX5_29 [uncultured Caudovirales phage]ASN70709.1 hypothetical protein 9AX3_26 [uncultured Caudovirales phage]ASN70783.1 hypothetical protein 10AX4_47 [uncultured Caudovirales phage]
MKPIMKWSCRELNDGWVMIGVVVDLSGPGEGECMLGYRRAVHPFHFDEAENPVIAFGAVISEMTQRIQKGYGVGAPTHSASRACAFEPSPIQPRFTLVQTDSGIAGGAA